MDKYEYRIKSEEIKQLIAEGDYVQAAEIADTIDWRRVKSVMMLCTISDLYKINRRYEDARDMLLLAYERRPGGRTICYSLCELSIKMEDFLQAVEYYKEFVQVAPKDSGRFVLQYKLYEAQDVSLEERIEVLEELKRHDYREKWAYELAYLYHRVGLATRCVEECDELILWFGEGKYVIKAMELKALHQPLTAEQQEKYDGHFGNQAQEDMYAYVEEQEEQTDLPQAEAAIDGDTQVYEQVQVNEQFRNPGQPEEMDIHVKTMDVGQYNTINLQAELAAGLREVLGENSITNAIVAPMLQGDTGVMPVSQMEEETVRNSEIQAEEVESEVFFGETGEMADIGQKQGEILPPEQEVEAVDIEEQAKEPDFEQESAELEIETEQASTTNIKEQPKKTVNSDKKELSEEVAAENTDSDITAGIVMEQMRRAQAGHAEEQVLSAQPPKELAGVLSQESDGQISLVMPESENLEKQITGQMSIDDILVEWERMKKENEEKRKEEVRRHVLQQTGRMFTEFEASVRDGLLEQLENGAILGEDSEEKEQEEFVSELSDESEPEEIESDFSDEGELEEAESDLSDDEDFEELENELLEEAAHIEKAIAQDDSADVETEKADDFVEEGNSDAVEELEEIIEAEETERHDFEKEEVSREPAKLRALTREEKELYAPFIQSRASREQLIRAVDNITLAAYTGNVIITGEEGTNTLGLAQNIAREIQIMDSNFSGKVAKISGKTFNKKDVKSTINQMKNGALIIEGASKINKDTVQKMHKCLQQESLGIILILEDNKKSMNRFLAENELLGDAFTARIDVEALSNDALVAFGRQYAREREYSIDELGILALHTRIEDMQTSDHAVTVLEVKEIIDEAIRHADKKTLGHFFDVLLAKRYDDEDMIILTEKDFV